MAVEVYVRRDSSGTYSLPGKKRSIEPKETRVLGMVFDPAFNADVLRVRNANFGDLLLSDTEDSYASKANAANCRNCGTGGGGGGLLQDEMVFISNGSARYKLNHVIALPLNGNVEVFRSGVRIPTDDVSLFAADEIIVISATDSGDEIIVKYAYNP